MLERWTLDRNGEDPQYRLPSVTARSGSTCYLPWMADSIAGINPEMLKWARRLAGLSVADIAQKLKKDPAVIQQWESGESSPTYVQLEQLAGGILKRPIAVFFFPEPPEEPDPEQSFRTLPDFELAELSAQTRFRIRDARALIDSLYRLNDGRNPSRRRIFDDLRLTTDMPVSEAASKVRDYLLLGGEKPRLRPPETALAGWRTLVEEAGIFVFKNSFSQREVSGFCLYDDEFPVIYLNNSTSKTRQLFSLLHELVHLLLGSSTITKSDDSYISSLSEEERRIEVYCNLFAAEFLVPVAEFRRRSAQLSPTDSNVSLLANQFGVSREVILRRYLDDGLLNSNEYRVRTMAWNREYEEGRSGGSEGNYYNTKAAYLGDAFLDLAFRRYHQGSIDLSELADHLNMKAKNVPNLEYRYLNRSA